jgi:uncharacterized protein (DUF433 family)
MRPAITILSVSMLDNEIGAHESHDARGSIPHNRSSWPTIRQPCIRGFRITVWDVLDMLASGMTEDEILRDYPHLEKADFPAVYSYASQTGREHVTR